MFIGSVIAYDHNARKENTIKQLMKRSLLVGGVLSTVGLVGASGAMLGSANASTPESGQQTLVDKIAGKFHLNKTDVQNVFDEERSDHQAARQARIDKRLQALVDNGTITTKQKTAIEAKFKELQATRDADRGSFADMTDSERRSAMDKQRTNLQTWAKQQGLDLSKLQGIFMGSGPHHGGPGGMHQDMD
jgi:hypothetical protein